MQFYELNTYASGLRIKNYKYLANLMDLKTGSGILFENYIVFN